MKVKPIRVEGEVAFVPLSQGLEAVIDAADVPLVEGHNWYASFSRGTAYAKRTVNRPVCLSIRMHRVILNAPDHMDVDHVDCDGLNNRRSNLRLATVAENNRNQRIRSTNTSGFKGVSFHKGSGKWAATIWVDGAPRHLGKFIDPEAAYSAYCSASQQLHGDFGRVA